MLGLPGTFSMVMCRVCGLVYLDPRPSDALLSRYYPDSYPPYQAGKGLARLGTILVRRWTARKIRAWLPSGAKVLEIGCASGDLLVSLRNEGLEVMGIEPSPYASSVARDHFQLNVHTGTILDAPLNAESFDAIVMRGVLEHLASPYTALVRVASLLKPEGFLFLATPNFNSLDRRVFGEFWHGLQIPRHLNLFTVRTLSTLLDMAGFTIRQVRYRLVTNDWIKSSRYILEEKFGKRDWLRLVSMQNPLLHLVFLPVTATQRLFRIGGRMEVVALKTHGGGPGYSRGR